MTLPTNITLVPKNDYFTYFSANGQTFTQRQADQVWNASASGTGDPRLRDIKVSGYFEEVNTSDIRVHVFHLHDMV